MNNPLHGKINAESMKFECRVRLRDDPAELRVMTVEAKTRDEVMKQLQEKGYLVISISDMIGETLPVPGPVEPGRMHTPSSPKKKAAQFQLIEQVTTRELIFLAIQLSTLLKAGVALLRSLEIIRAGTVNPFFKRVLGKLEQAVSSGTPLSAGMKSHPKVFPWLWINLVEVGEATGKLPEVLEEIAHYQEAAQRVKSKVISAFMYPGILTVAVVLAMTFLMVFIVPKFAEIFESQHMQLPLITQVVLQISDVIRHQFVWVLLVVIGSIVGVTYMRRTPPGKILFDHFRLTMPIFGELLLQIGVVRFCRGLGTLLKAGVQILSALEIAGRLVENHFLESKIKEVGKAVRGGQGLGLQLESRSVFPVFMTQLVSIGEESGQIEKFLDLISNFYEDRVDTFLTRLSTLLEPLLLIVMGGIIGTVVVSMFLPIIQLSTGGGG